MEQINKQKSVFDYIVNRVTVSEDTITTPLPQFLSFIPINQNSAKNIEIENDLFGKTRPLSKCVESKYIPKQIE